MPSGILGQSAPAATTNTTLYTVPANRLATLNISVCNRGSTAALVRLAVAATGTPANAEWIEFDTTVPANGVLERTGIVANAAENIVVYSSTANMSFSAWGYEEVV
jgi:hypothetical protein